MPDLVCLDTCRHTHEHQYQLLSAVIAPLRVDEREQSLTRHPDHPLTRYAVRGLGEGFRIKFRPVSCLKSINRNIKLVLLPPEMVTGDIKTVRSIPNGHNTGKIRLIRPLPPSRVKLARLTALLAEWLSQKNHTSGTRRKTTTGTTNWFRHKAVKQGDISEEDDR